MTTMAPGDVFQQWRKANQQAKTAEDSMFRRSLSALDGSGEPPSQADADVVKGLRREADHLFTLAMAQLGKAIAEIRRPLRRSPVASPAPPPQPG
jgi:hypothetical protein